MTFSIVARDARTGQFGVATATAGPAVGALVPHTRAGVGAVATQAMTNPYLAVDTLAALDRMDAETALGGALARDADAAMRQVVVVDGAGRVAGWTGESCIEYAGHLLGDGVAVAGNMLAGPAVLDSMMSAFEAHRGDLPTALLRALEAGAAAGGDSRGIGSAALRVQGAEAYADVDIRVDWSDAPLRELAVLLEKVTVGSYAEFFAEVPRRG